MVKEKANMQNQAIRLSIKFFEEVKGFGKGADGKVQAPDNYKHLIMNSILEILNGGMTPQELEALINRYRLTVEKHNEVYGIEEIIAHFGIKVVKGKLDKDPDNLLERGTFYYHPALQVVPPPPVIRQLDDGSFESSYDTEPFFLEMKEKFTLDDLVNYFYNVIGIDDGFRDRDKGAFRHILKTYNLDVVLYTIDESNALSQDLNRPRPQSPFDIRDYLEEGKMILKERKNTCYMEGLDRVIPRNSK